jgi:thymidylate synthase (FAD)
MVVEYPYKGEDGRWYKPCHNCNDIQSYLRYHYALNSFNLKKLCKKCSNRITENCHRGWHREIRLSWFNKFKTSAEIRGIEFNISIDDITNKYFKEKFSVRAIGITMPLIEEIPDSESLISYQARVSNPNNQLNFETADKLLSYCATKGHWSIFDMSNLILEIKAPRDISRQVLRHSSAKFQEYSQRYADISDDMFCLRDIRMQDNKNRQNSITNTYSENEIEEWYKDQEEVIQLIQSKVKKWRTRDVAKECTRVFMPEGLTMSVMCMNATIRTWNHDVGLRTERVLSQDEHCDIADECKKFVLQYFPSLCNILEQDKTIL